MGTLSENISRRANRSDDCTGHFWEQRFKLRDLADESAILVCTIYVDLNPIRAGQTVTPEQSRYTSAYDRIQGRKQRRAGRHSTKQPVEASRCDRWLCELTLQEGARVDSQAAVCDEASWRASDKGLLPILLEDYLKLLDWTGRQFRQDKRRAIPNHLAPILERLYISQDYWLETVTQFDSRFGQVVGRVEAGLANFSKLQDLGLSRQRCHNI